MSRARDLADRVLHNRTHEDTDGGRESIVTFKGEQSGGEISTLAQIQASHDGSADDQKSDLIFRTNDGSDGTSPTEVLRTNSAGNLLITSSDQFGLTLNTTDSNGGFIALKTSGTAKGYIGTSHHLVSGGSPSEDDITIRAEGKLQFAIGATEELRLDSDGLKFNGDTAAANALSDYETGTWTPSVYQAGWGLAGTTQQYTKIGRKVTITCDTVLTGSGNGNDMKIAGLPFASIANGYASGSGYTQYYPSAVSGSNAHFTPFSGSSSNIIGFMNGNGVQYDGDNFSAGYLNFTVTYFTDA